MNKEYYNNCIKEFIQELIYEKDSIVEDIENITTYIDFKSDSQDLRNSDITSVNQKRNNIGAIYQLIEDLGQLKK